MGGTLSSTKELVDAEAEASEASRNEPSRGIKHRAGTSAVYSLRLPADKIEKLQKLAASTGVPPTVLLRQWIIERLDADPANELRMMVHAEVRAAVAEALTPHGELQRD